MKNYLLLFLLFCFLSGYAQDTIPKPKCRHSIYLEIGGIGGFGSVNYENVIALKNKFSLGFRGGFSTVHLVDYTRKFNPDLIFPVSVQVLYGTKHRIEIGVGQTISNFPATNMEKNPIHIRITNFSTTFTVGYRFEHHKTGIFFRCGYTPIVEKNKYYKHWGEISIGYTFK
jgi:hypothetical protein